MIDLYSLYKMIKKLSTPFDEWEAFKLGIIDKDGNRLKRFRDLKTREEIRSWTRFDLAISKIKQMIEKVPGGKTRLASYAAALYLLKEQEAINTVEDYVINTQLMGDCLDYVNENFCLIEEGPTTGVADVAGIGAGPQKFGERTFSIAQMKKYKRRNKTHTKFREDEKEW